MRRFFAPLLLIGLAAAAANAVSTFGKNKVKYYDDDWYVVAGDHVDLYFYEGERPLAETAIVMAEETWDEYSRRMGFSPSRKIPLVIYSSHAEFEETNILPYLIPEGVGGFTELFKNRVVVPFEGSYGRFRRVLRHEIAHFFLFEKLRAVYNRYGRYDYGPPPFWFVEGFSEYYAGEEEAATRMVLADALYGGYLVSLAEGYGPSGYLAYKEGESALRYLATQYGEDKITRVLDHGWLTREWRRVLDLSLPEPLEKFDRGWRAWLQRQYYPRYADHDDLLGEGAKGIIGGEGFRAGAAWLRRDTLVYLSDEDGRPSLYAVTVNEAGAFGQPEVLLRSGFSRDMTSLRIYLERPACTGGGLIAVAGRAGPRDRLYVYDYGRREVVESYEYPDLPVIGTPSFSPDGGEIAFRGISREGRADIYIVNRATRVRRQLTDDLYDDVYPCWTDDGVVFSSNRGGDISSPFYNLFQINRAGGTPAPLTAGPWRDLYPQTDGAGALVFVSDRDGMFDVYRWQPEGTRRLSRTLTGVLESAPRPPGTTGETAVILLREGKYVVALTEFKASEETTNASPAATAPPPPNLRPRPSPYHVADYETHFSLDYFSAEVAYGPEFGTSTGAVISLTDILNDQNILIKIGNDAEVLDDLLARTSVGVDYYNLRRRLGWGASAFRYLSNDFDYKAGLTGLLFTETRTGGGGTFSFPLDRFHRLGASLYAYELKREWETGAPPTYGTKISPYVSAARDTSLWHLDGPVDGDRANVTLGVTQDGRRGRRDYTYAAVDIRWYVRTTRRQCFAFRTAGVGTFGPDARPLYSGGSLSLRGYDLFSFRGRRFAMFNAEYRFPVLEPSALRTSLGPALLPPVRGALFADAGRMWDDPAAQPEGWRGDFGISFRYVLWGVITLRTDHALLTDFERWGPFVPIKFFVGWSY